MTCQSTQEMIPQDMFASCRNQVKKTTQIHMQRFLNKNFAKKAEVITDSRERTAESLFNNLESVASVVEGSDSKIDDNSVPTARCIQDTEKRQLVTKSGLPRLRCCVCHLHHKRAMNAPASVRQVFKTVLQQVCHYKDDVIAGDAIAAAYKYYKRQECTIPQLPFR